MKIMEEKNEYLGLGNQLVGNIELIEYRDHTMAQDITIRNYKEYYSAYTIIVNNLVLKNRA